MIGRKQILPRPLRLLSVAIPKGLAELGETSLDADCITGIGQMFRIDLMRFTASDTR